jgi:hypothetical protein
VLVHLLVEKWAFIEKVTAWHRYCCDNVIAVHHDFSGNTVNITGTVIQGN